ncbi:MAG TPA: hypothetical protein VF323_11015 [Candidatus Limnocylindrales bacterium]
MAHLACWACGRQIYTVAPLDALFTEERRCPRCSATLQPERRGPERRVLIRRQYVPDGTPIREDRTDERRHDRRRRNPADGSNRLYGWSAH